MVRHHAKLASFALALSFLARAGVAQDAPPAQDQKKQEEAIRETTPPSEAERTLLEQLMDQIAELKKDLLDTRSELATTKMKADAAERELAELKQFISDNREFGDDFARYREIKEITEREERRRAAEQARLRREEEAAKRLGDRNISKAQRDAQRIEEERLDNYRRAGFSPLGLDTFIGRTGFFYNVERTTGSRVEYEPNIGHFLEPIGTSRVDYSQMTISGSVLNASAEVRNLGIAVAFFDNRGNQVGSATIQVNNARPNVPYPFTTTVQMALDGPFSSSSSWVLYADAVPDATDGGQVAPAAH